MADLPSKKVKKTKKVAEKAEKATGIDEREGRETCVVQWIGNSRIRFTIKNKYGVWYWED